MDARLPRTGRVLHLVQPTSDRVFPSGFEPGRLVTFTSQRPLANPDATDLDDDDPVMVQITWGLWSDLGRPDHITTAIMPGVVSSDQAITEAWRESVGP